MQTFTASNARDLILATAAVVAAVALAAPARAAVVSYTASASTRGDESAPNRLPGFDDALGTLTGATVSFSGDISGRASGSQAITRPETVTVSPYLSLGGLAESGRSLRVDLDTLSVSPTYTAAGGYTLTWATTVSASVALPLAAIGEDGGPVLYTIAGGYDLRPNPATFYDDGAPFSGTATVTYTYTAAGDGAAPVSPASVVVQDVPEPASFAAFGAGLLGLAAARRRRV